MIVGINFSDTIFKEEVRKQNIYIVVIILIQIIYFFIADEFLKRKSKSTLDDPKIIIEFERDRLKSLRRLLIQENFDIGEIGKIQVIINEVINRKAKIIAFSDINNFIVKPFIILSIPVLTIFLDHLTQNKRIEIQAEFVSFALTMIQTISIICFVFAATLRWILYRKYYDFIDDLRLLQIVKDG